MRRASAAALAVALAAAALALLGPASPAGAAPADPPRTTVLLSTPLYDSPGAWVPSIVTVRHPPAGYAVALGLRASRGATVRCTGGTWRNRFADTVSRRCYVRLPATRGRVDLTGRAVLTRDGRPTLVRTGRGRPVQADGVASAPLPFAQLRGIERCHRTSDRVLLTFDDGGSAAQVGSILATLRRNGVRAAFFFRGDWARAHPDLQQRLRSSGHHVGDHTSTHVPLSRASVAEIGRQVRGGTAASGEPRLLRPPFGAGAFSARLVRAAADLGHRVCRWTTDTYDWDDQTPAVMARRVRWGDHRSPPVTAGGNVLMHAAGRHTAAGLQGIIDAVRARGLELEPLR